MDPRNETMYLTEFQTLIYPYFLFNILKYIYI